MSPETPLQRRITSRYKEELDEVAAGERTVFSSYGDVAEEYGTYKGTVARIVRRTGLQKELKEAREEATKISFPASQETAWFLGAMTGAGIINKSGHGSLSLELTSRNDALLQAFIATGEYLIGREHKKPAEHVVAFHSTRHARALGNFRLNERPETLRSHYPWILEEEYINPFASGLLEAKGRIRITELRDVRFFTSHEELAEFYVSIFTLLGLEKPTIKKNAAKKGGVVGISITGTQNLQLLADKITCLNPEMQNKLAAFKTMKKEKYTVNPPSSSREIVAEWKKLTEQLGHPPSSTEIVRLRAQEGEDQTRFPTRTYITYFGLDEETGERKFSIARRRLAELITLPEDDPALAQETKPTQVFPDAPMN